MKHHVQAVVTMPLAFALVSAGCGVAPAPDAPSAAGHRVQHVAVASSGSVTIPAPCPIRSAATSSRSTSRPACSMRVAPLSSSTSSVTRAGQRASLSGAGPASRRRPTPLAAGRGGATDGQVTTVFELALNGLEPEEGATERHSRRRRAWQGPCRRQRDLERGEPHEASVRATPSHAMEGARR